MKLNLTMLLRIMLEESFKITLARVMSMVMVLMLTIPVLRVQNMIKDEPEDLLEKILGTGPNITCYHRGCFFSFPRVLVQAECVHCPWLLGFLLPPLLKRHKGVL